MLTGTILTTAAPFWIVDANFSSELLQSFEDEALVEKH